MNPEALATELLPYRHETDVVIRYGDIDMLHHVNNAKYLTYLEMARVKYAMDVLGWNGEQAAFPMILARIEVDYLLPLLISDRCAVRTRVSRIGRKSYVMDYLILTQGRILDPLPAPDAWKLAARSRSVLVGWDPETQRSLELPDDFRRRVRAFEPQAPEES